MKSVSIRAGLAVLLCCALLCTCGLPLCRAAGQSAEDVIVEKKNEELLNESDLIEPIRLNAVVRTVKKRITETIRNIDKT
jgi:hypothetical protein